MYQSWMTVWENSRILQAVHKGRKYKLEVGQSDMCVTHGVMGGIQDR